jgi:hypothetical protein
VAADLCCTTQPHSLGCAFVVSLVGSHGTAKAGLAHLVARTRSGGNREISPLLGSSAQLRRRERDGTGASMKVSGGEKGLRVAV